MSRNGNFSHTFDQRIEALKDSVRALADLGSEQVGAIKDRAIDVKDQAVDGAGTLLARAGRTIKHHPFAAVGIAFGIGYIAMRLFRR